MTGDLELGYSSCLNTHATSSAMSANPTRPPFSTDRPITSSAQDRLNRRDFAFALGDTILTWDGADSLVIGLNGEWGCGKTSVINLIRERVGTTEPAPDIIGFNPWEWSGHEELATAFFREIELALNLRETKEGPQLAERFENYARLLNAGGTAADSIVPFATAMSAILVVAGRLRAPARARRCRRSYARTTASSLPSYTSSTSR
jgi:KAP family P-loop domain